MTPLNRLRQFPQLQTQAEPQPMNPAPAGMTLQWQPDIGGEQDGGAGGYSNAAMALGDYLKKRRSELQPSHGGAAGHGGTGIGIEPIGHGG